MSSTEASKNMSLEDLPLPLPLEDSREMNGQVAQVNTLVEEIQIADDANENSKEDDGFTTVSKKMYKKMYKSEKSKPVESTLSEIDEYPDLGTELTKNQKRAIIEHNTGHNTVAAAAKTNNPDLNSHPSRWELYRRSGPVSAMMMEEKRSTSFAEMADKEKIAASLKYTKACRAVTGPMTNPRKGEDAKFGVCTRETCTFAHSQEELNAPMCRFDPYCRIVNGKRDRITNKIIPNTKCKFRHSFETINEWIFRSGVNRPPLPPTSEHSRKPQPRRSSQRTQVLTTTPPVAPKKREWGPPVETSKESAKKTTVKKSTRKNDDSSSDSESDSSSSDSDSDYKRRRHSSIRKSKSRRQVIRVPTKELATIAIQAAFDRGQYNVQVIVE